MDRSCRLLQELHSRREAHEEFCRKMSWASTKFNQFLSLVLIIKQIDWWVFGFFRDILPPRKNFFHLENHSQKDSSFNVFKLLFNDNKSYFLDIHLCRFISNARRDILMCVSSRLGVKIVSRFLIFYLFLYFLPIVYCFVLWNHDWEHSFRSSGRWWSKKSFLECFRTFFRFDVYEYV